MNSSLFRFLIFYDANHFALLSTFLWLKTIGVLGEQDEIKGTEQLMDEWNSMSELEILWLDSFIKHKHE